MGALGKKLMCFGVLGRDSWVGKHMREREREYL